MGAHAASLLMVLSLAKEKKIAFKNQSPGYFSFCFTFQWLLILWHEKTRFKEELGGKKNIVKEEWKPRLWRTAGSWCSRTMQSTGEKQHLFQRCLFTVSGHLAARWAAGKLKKGEGGTHRTGTVMILGGFVESYILRGTWLEVGCRLGGLNSGGDTWQSLDGWLGVCQVMKQCWSRVEGRADSGTALRLSPFPTSLSSPLFLHPHLNDLFYLLFMKIHWGEEWDRSCKHSYAIK